MERSQAQTWIQVIGRIAVHRPGRDTHEPAGASRVLLSILVAAGPEGATLEEIASAYWNQSRPTSWKIALRVSASHLSAQLPDGWDIATQDGRFCISPGVGFIDVWRIDQLFGAGYLAGSDIDTTDIDTATIDWVSDGDLFPGVIGVEIVDRASHQLLPAVQSLRAMIARGGVPTAQNEVVLQRIRASQRSILLATSEFHATVAQAIRTDTSTDYHVVVGDEGLLLPLGPFAITFPELRTEIALRQGVVEQGSVAHAFRVVADALAVQAAYRPQRLILTDAHRLDTESLQLASLLIDRGRLTDFSLLICGDPDYRDIRWLDFVSRSVTAGCELIKPDRL